MSNPTESQPKPSITYSEAELKEIMAKAVSDVVNAKHRWRQRGAYIVCTSCPNEHGIYIGTTKILTGIRDDGTPIIVNI